MTGRRVALRPRSPRRPRAVVIRRYSTSFGLASRLLGPAVRQHVENIYALVRLADEIVDGVAAEAGLDGDASRARCSTSSSARPSEAMRCGYSANLVVHAFACTARGDRLRRRSSPRPFFASMRADLSADRAHARVVRPLRLRIGRGRRADVPARVPRRPPLIRSRRGAARRRRPPPRRGVPEGQLPARPRRRLRRASAAATSPASTSTTFAEAAEGAPSSTTSTTTCASPGEPDRCCRRRRRRAVALAQGLFAELTRRLRATPASVLVTDARPRARPRQAAHRAAARRPRRLRPPTSEPDRLAASRDDPPAEPPSATRASQRHGRSGPS